MNSGKCLITLFMESKGQPEKKPMHVALSHVGFVGKLTKACKYLIAFSVYGGLYTMCTDLDIAGHAISLSVNCTCHNPLDFSCHSWRRASCLTWIMILSWPWMEMLLLLGWKMVVSPMLASLLTLNNALLGYYEQGLYLFCCS